MNLFERYFNQDCIAGAREHLECNSIDLIVTDPPYGIDGDTLHKHYNRNESLVVDGYVEVSEEKYAEFSQQWICEAERVLSPGGSIYIISGYTNLPHILNALKATSLLEQNHLIWKYNFGVYTTQKYVSSHYHILYYYKPPRDRVTFNTFSRYGSREKTEMGGSKLYQDLEDVWVINRNYKPGQKKNKNALPVDLLIKILQYSSAPGDVVADFFLGGFSTARVAKGLNRAAVGFEINRNGFKYHKKIVHDLDWGDLIDSVPHGENDLPENQGKAWSDSEKQNLLARYAELSKQPGSKGAVIDQLQEEFGRGYWAIQRMLKLLES